MASSLGGAFGLELEGLSAEDQEFEVARRFVEFAGEAATNAAMSPPNANPDEVKALGDLRQSLFMGNALRGMLLNAYAFGTMGTIAFIAGIGAFIAAGVLLVLVFLGFRHAKHVNNFVPKDITNEAPARV